MRVQIGKFVTTWESVTCTRRSGTWPGSVSTSRCLSPNISKPSPSWAESISCLEMFPELSMFTRKLSSRFYISLGLVFFRVGINRAMWKILCIETVMQKLFRISASFQKLHFWGQEKSLQNNVFWWKSICTAFAQRLHLASSGWHPLYDFTKPNI